MATDRSIPINEIDFAAISAVPALQNLAQAMMSERSAALTHALNEVRLFTRTEQQTPALSACAAVLTRAVRAFNHVPQVADDRFIVQCAVVDSSGAPVPACKLVLTDSLKLLDQMEPTIADADGYMMIAIGRQQFSRLFDEKASVYATVFDPSGNVISRPTAGLTAAANGLAVLDVVMPPAPTLSPIDTVVTKAAGTAVPITAPVAKTATAAKTATVARTAPVKKTAPAAKTAAAKKAAPAAKRAPGRKPRGTARDG